MANADVIVFCMACRSSNVMLLSRGPGRCLDCGSYRIGMAEVRR